jgi:MFS family permease
MPGYLASVSSETERKVPAYHLYRWVEPAVVSVALVAMASGFGQFGAVSALGDVAKAFGHATSGTSITDQAGLSGTELGLGLAILRLASLAGLPCTSLADRFGRKRTLFTSCALGLALTVLAALSPSYWWFVAIFAVGRPLLSTTSAIAQVSAAEETDSRNRAKAVAMVAAGYGIGSGLTAVLHGLAGGTLGFRGIFGLAVVPLALLPVAWRYVREPDRFTVAAAAAERPTTPVLGAIDRRYRQRLVVVLGLAFSVSVITGPANSYAFVYAQNIRHISGPEIAVMVVVAAVFGLCGLLLGRYLADQWGRRPTCAAALVAMAGVGVLTYSGSTVAFFVGYELGVLAASTFAPAAGAFANELFPTEVRASVAGWNIAAGVIGAAIGLLAFGAIADAGAAFSVGAVAVFLPALGSLVLFLFLPETRGREPEDLWTVNVLS